MLVHTAELSYAFQIARAQPYCSILMFDSRREESDNGIWLLGRLLGRSGEQPFFGGERELNLLCKLYC